MNQDELLRHLEGLLFVAAEPAEIAQLAAALDVRATEVEAALEVLSAQFQARGLRLQRRGQRVALATAPESAPYIEKFLGLSMALMVKEYDSAKRFDDAHGCDGRRYLRKARAVAHLRPSVAWWRSPG